MNSEGGAPAARSEPTSGPAGESLTLTADPQSARKARRFVAGLLAREQAEQWELPALLLVTELVTNAILHARTELTVTVEVGTEAVAIRVRDGSRRPPARRHYSPDATTGRGLRLVEQLSRDWGVDTDASGKTVWVVIGAVDWEALWALSGGPDAEEPMMESRTA